MPVLQPETDDEGDSDDDTLPPIAEGKEPIDAVQPKVN